MHRINKVGNFSLELKVESFGDRFKKLFLSGKKIVYIKNEFDNSTFRYRTYNVVQALSKQKDYIVTYFLSSELEKVSTYIKNISVIIFQRAMWDIYIENFVYMAKNNSIPVIYDIDDLFVNPKYVPLYLNNLGRILDSSAYLDQFYFTSRYYCVACKCDGFITTNDFLKKYIKKDFLKPVWVIPNFLNMEQEYYSKIIREKSNEIKSKFIIGYFSGSPSHQFDFSLVVDDIFRLFETYNNIFLKIVGFIEIPIKLRRFQNRIIQVPLVSYEELQYEIGEVDLNIVPLQNNVFNNCKSELKFFEAGIVNVISCCSPTYIYKKIVNDGENGFLCKDGEWFSVIEKIYLNKNKLNNIKSKAYETSINLYSVKNQTQIITTVYNDILSLRKK